MCRLQAAIRAAGAGTSARTSGASEAASRNFKKSYDAFASARRRRDSARIKSRAASLGGSQTLHDLSHSLRAVCPCACGMTREHLYQLWKGTARCAPQRHDMPHANKAESRVTARVECRNVSNLNSAFVYIAEWNIRQDQNLYVADTQNDRRRLHR